MTLAQPKPTAQSAELIHMDGNIHRITIPPTKKAIDDHFPLVLEVIDNHVNPETEKILLMFILGNVIKIPTRYFVSRATNFWSKHKATHVQMRVAYMLERNILVEFLQQFLTRLGFKSERRFFKMDQEQEAIAWLLEGKMIESPES